MRIIFLLAVPILLFTTLVLAQPLPTPVVGQEISWVLSTIQWVVEQFKAKNYLPAISGVVMMLVWALRATVFKTLKPTLLPWVSAGAGIVVAIATKLVGLAAGASGPDILSAVVAGLSAGVMATGLWELIGKKVSEKFTPKPLPQNDIEAAKVITETLAKKE